MDGCTAPSFIHGLVHPKHLDGVKQNIFLKSLKIEFSVLSKFFYSSFSEKERQPGDIVAFQDTFSYMEDINSEIPLNENKLE